MTASDLTRPGILNGTSGAVISPCGGYRYWLHRAWMHGQGWTVFVMLNPSTADADLDDPTIRRCIGFAKRLGTSGLVVVNLFAWRSTDPDALLRALDPVGPENHAYVTLACELAAHHEDNGNGGMHVPGKVICAWGAHPAADRDHIAEVLGWIDLGYGNAFCLGRTKTGAPRHPLYVPSVTALELFEPR